MRTALPLEHLTHEEDDDSTAETAKEQPNHEAQGEPDTHCCSGHNHHRDRSDTEPGQQCTDPQGNDPFGELVLPMLCYVVQPVGLEFLDEKHGAGALCHV